MQKIKQIQLEELHQKLYFKPIYDQLSGLSDKVQVLKDSVSFSQFSRMIEKQITQKMDTLTKHLNNTKIYIVFMGTTSSGKSTFLNALLGQQLLPSRNQSCTTQVAQIGYKSEQKITINQEKFNSLENASKHLTQMLDSPNMDKIIISTQSYFHMKLSQDLQDRVFFIDTPGINISDCSDKEYIEHFGKIDQLIDLNKYAQRINVWLSDYTSFDREKKAQQKIIMSLFKNDAEQNQQQNEIQNEIQNNDQIQQSNGERFPFFFILNKFDQRKESEDLPLEQIYKSIKDVFDSGNIFKISALKALNYNIMNYGTKEAQDNFIKKYYQNTESNLEFTDESQARKSCQEKIKNNHQLIQFQDFKEFMSKISQQIRIVLDETFLNFLNDLKYEITNLEYGEETKKAKEQLTQQQKQQLDLFLNTFEYRLQTNEEELYKLQSDFVITISEMIQEAKDQIENQDPQAVISKNLQQTIGELDGLNKIFLEMTIKSKEQLLHNLNWVLQYGRVKMQKNFRITFRKQCL